MRRPASSSQRGRLEVPGRPDKPPESPPGIRPHFLEMAQRRPLRATSGGAILSLAPRCSAISRIAPDKQAKRRYRSRFRKRSSPRSSMLWLGIRMGSRSPPSATHSRSACRAARCNAGSPPWWRRGAWSGTDTVGPSATAFRAAGTCQPPNRPKLAPWRQSTTTFPSPPRERRSAGPFALPSRSVSQSATAGHSLTTIAPARRGTSRRRFDASGLISTAGRVSPLRPASPRASARRAGSCDLRAGVRSRPGQWCRPGRRCSRSRAGRPRR